jgi:hypothetical protein
MKNLNKFKKSLILKKKKELKKMKKKGDGLNLKK